jgi:hypothetical protein
LTWLQYVGSWAPVLLTRTVRVLVLKRILRLHGGVARYTCPLHMPMPVAQRCPLHMPVTHARCTALPVTHARRSQ